MTEDEVGGRSTRARPSPGEPLARRRIQLAGPGETTRRADAIRAETAIRRRAMSCHPPRPGYRPRGQLAGLGMSE